MYIEHLAIWCKDLEATKAFYCDYFQAIPNEKYENKKNGFQSYFLSLGNGPRLELMKMPGIPENMNDVMAQCTGLVHFAVSVGSREKVDEITELLRKKGIRIVGEPRKTGDGYYESALLDPEGNRIEITI